jgi:putative SOS response-associated peptidase YedK
VPALAKDLKIGAHAINAAGHVAGKSRCFARPSKRCRCLVPATGYFEWTCEAGSKQPYFIYPSHLSFVMFAGLWEAWKDKADPAAEWVKTFTIITGEQGKISGDIHA